jgi:hypothetical protein
MKQIQKKFKSQKEDLGNILVDEECGLYELRHLLNNKETQKGYLKAALKDGLSLHQAKTEMQQLRNWNFS